MDAGGHLTCGLGQFDVVGDLVAKPSEPFAEVGAGGVVRISGLGGQQREKPGQAWGLLIADSRCSHSSLSTTRRH